MSKKSFKSLFVVNEDDSSPSPSQQITFPKPENTEAPKPSFSNMFNFGSPKQSEASSVPQDYLDKATQIYEQGFDSLNQVGYDFFEFYKAILAHGIEKTELYPMAFSMAKSMDNSLSKEKLIQTADYYLSKINSVYIDNNTKGLLKKEELEKQKNAENQNLLNEVSSMEQQIEALKVQITDRKNKLNAIDGKYSPMIRDIENKITANGVAKNTIVESIETVKNGILNNIK